MKDKLKQLDTKIVETTSGLIALALLLLAGATALAVGAVIPILIAAALLSGDLTEAGQYILLEVVGFYLYRGIAHILKEAKGVLD